MCLASLGVKEGFECEWAGGDRCREGTVSKALCGHQFSTSIVIWHIIYITSHNGTGATRAWCSS